MRWLFWAGLMVGALAIGLLMFAPAGLVLVMGTITWYNPPEIVSAGIVIDADTEVEGVGPLVMGALYEIERRCSSGTRKKHGRSRCRSVHELLEVYGQGSVHVRGDDGIVRTFTPAPPDEAFPDRDTRADHVLVWVASGDRLTVVQGAQGLSITPKTPDQVLFDHHLTASCVMLTAIPFAMPSVAWLVISSIGSLIVFMKSKVAKS